MAIICYAPVITQGSSVGLDWVPSYIKHFLSPWEGQETVPMYHVLNINLLFLLKWL